MADLGLDGVLSIDGSNKGFRVVTIRSPFSLDRARRSKPGTRGPLRLSPFPSELPRLRWERRSRVSSKDECSSSLVRGSFEGFSTARENPLVSANFSEGGCWYEVSDEGRKAGVERPTVLPNASEDVTVSKSSE